MHVHCTLHPIDSYCSRYQLHWNCWSKWHSGKQSTCQAGNEGSVPGSGRSPGKGHDTPLQYSCLENPMDRGAWRAAVPRVAKSRTRLNWPSTQESDAYSISQPWKSPHPHKAMNDAGSLGKDYSPRLELTCVRDWIMSLSIVFAMLWGTVSSLPSEPASPACWLSH